MPKGGVIAAMRKVVTHHEIDQGKIMVECPECGALSASEHRVIEERTRRGKANTVTVANEITARPPVERQADAWTTNAPRNSGHTDAKRRHVLSPGPSLR